MVTCPVWPAGPYIVILLEIVIPLKPLDLTMSKMTHYVGRQ